MAEKIKLLIADDVSMTRSNITRLVEFDPGVSVVGQASTAEEAIEMAKKLLPDIILMDINMPGMDGIKATKIITNEIPEIGILIMSVQNEPEYFRQAMIAGAKDYLIKPFTSDELLHAIKSVYESQQIRRNRSSKDKQPSRQGKLITIFSTKGGIGKTTISTNLAVALGEKTGEKVCIVDADLQFGDAALFLNILPTATISDLVQDNLETAVLPGYLCSFNQNIKILPAPLRPEQAELVTGSHITTILKLLRTMFSYVIIDTSPSFNDVNLAILDVSDEVFVVTAMDLPTVKNVKLCLEIMDSLKYNHEKVKLVLNRANSDGGLDIKEVEDILRRRFTATLPSDGKTVVSSVNKGIPFVLSNPDTIVAESIFDLE